MTRQMTIRAESHAHSLCVNSLRKIILTWRENGNCRQNNTVRIGMMFSRVIRSVRRMIISKLNNYENIEKFPKLDEIEKIQKASKKKHGNLTETVEQTVNDWEK